MSDQIDNGFRPDPAKIVWRWIPPAEIRDIPYSDCGEEYVIEQHTDPPVAGEIVLWGRYRNHGWIINPWNCRYVCAELLRQLRQQRFQCQDQQKSRQKSCQEKRKNENS